MAYNELVPELGGEELKEYVKEGNAVIDFYADWCMPCLTMGPIIEEIAEKLKGKIKVAKVNVGDYPEIAQKFNVNSIPHFIIFKDGKKIEGFTGTLHTEEFEEKIKEFI